MVLGRFCYTHIMEFIARLVKLYIKTICNDFIDIGFVFSVYFSMHFSLIFIQLFSTTRAAVRKTLFLKKDPLSVVRRVGGTEEGC